MRQQRWLHLPAPAKTRCRTSDPGTHAPPVVFSSLNFEECSFFLFESVLKSFFAVPQGYPRLPKERTTLAVVRPQETLSGYQAEAPDFLFLLRRSRCQYLGS